MYELFIANKNYSSWSLRPWVLMRALGIPFRECMNVFGEGSNWESFHQFSPSGRVPCLHHEGRVVWDSLAIIEYLAERHDSVWPADEDARAWARCASAEMHAGFGALRALCSMSCGVRVQLREMPVALLGDLARIDVLWSEGLARFGGPFLAGAGFSAVDAFYAPVAFRVQSYDLQFGKQAMDYVERLLNLPAMCEWYEAALAEPWLDEAHEEEMHRTGTCLEDHRNNLPTREA